MNGSDKFILLNGHDSSIVLEAEIGERPSLLYWGPKLSEIDPATLKSMTLRQHAPGCADTEVEASLLNEMGASFAGPPGFTAHRHGKDWATLFSVREVDHATPNTVEIFCIDTVTKVSAQHSIEIDPETDVATFNTAITNDGEMDLTLDWCASAVLPVNSSATKMMGFTGRWADEFQIEDVEAFHGSYIRENRSGRTSHDCFPGLILRSPETNENGGCCFGYHLGWSGNSRIRADRLNDGRSFVQFGEYLYPGEIILAKGEAYETPRLYAARSDEGLSALSQKFHEHLRQKVMDSRIRGKSRPVHYNTWEAVYFDHDEEALFKLAETAASLGVERFVLDDGWFGDRRGPNAGLGDWTPSPDIYPEGLGPLINHVRSLGMEFGLWVEPEMVNPDSDLFRSHPDWIFRTDGREHEPSRNQFPLDLTRSDVRDYLFAQIDDLLSAYPINYLKWDMNRDVLLPGSCGRASAGRHVRAAYNLIDRLRARHPEVEIESCSSGGARADYGILQRTDRIWTSDTNDALDRHRIQRHASHFFPLEIMGAHVGPATCHITGRRLSMKLRVATAMFGHMGLELDLNRVPKSDLDTLKSGIELYKQHRDFLHSGLLHRLDTPSSVSASGVVAMDGSEAIFSWCNVTGHGETLPGRIVFTGLKPDELYRVRIIWPSKIKSVSEPSVIDALDLKGGGSPILGDMLMEIGIQVPLLHPETCLIWHLQA
ncbi:MAG: alpha-galactosidase [Pseudomonadota bacterium]